MVEFRELAENVENVIKLTFFRRLVKLPKVEFALKRTVEKVYYRIPSVVGPALRVSCPILSSEYPI